MLEKIRTKIAELMKGDSKDIEAIRSLVNDIEDEGERAEAVAALVSAHDRALRRWNPELAYNLLYIAAQIRPDDVEIKKAGARLLDQFLWNQELSLAVIRELAELDPDGPWSERLMEIELDPEKVQELYERYAELSSSDDPQIAARMSLRAAEMKFRYMGAEDEALELLERSFSLVPTKEAGVPLAMFLRRRERWTDLRGVLEKGAGVVEDPLEKAYLLVEAANFYYRDAELEKAEELVKAALEAADIEPAKELMVEVLSAQEKWEDLISFYEEEIRRTRHPDPGLYLQLGMLWWRQVGDIEAAEQYFQKFRKHDPASPVLLQFYQEYYVAQDDVPRYLAMLQQAYRTVQDDEERALEMTRRIAEVAERLMNVPDRAIDQWKKFLKKHPGHAEAIRELKRLYAETEKWTALVELYKEEEAALPKEDVEARKAVLREMARIYKEKLNVPLMAANVYQAMLQLDPDDEEVVSSLAAEYETLQRWMDLINLYTQAAERAEGERRKELYLKVARLWLEKLSNPNKAAQPLEKVLEVDPDNQEVLALLKEIYEKRRNWLGLYTIQLRELELAAEEERLEKALELADLAQNKIGKVEVAIDAWNRVLMFDPNHREALENLALLYERAKRYPAVVEVLLRLLEQEPDSIQHLEKAATLLTDKVGSTGAKAIELWERVLEAKPRHPKAVKILRTLYVAHKDWDALYRLFESQENWLGYIDTLLAAADGSEDREEKVQLYFKVADTWKEKMGKPERAIKAYERILEVDPDNRRAAEELLPIYERAQKWADVLKIRAILYRLEEDRDGRLLQLEEMVDIAETRLKDRGEAFRWAKEACRLSPMSEEYVTKLEQLASEVDGWEEVAALYEEVASSLEGQARDRMLLRLAGVKLERLGDFDGAEAVYRKVLEDDPDNLDALEGLAQIYELKEDWEALLGVLEKAAGLVQGERRHQYLSRMAAINEEKLGEVERALEIHRSILDEEPSYLPSLEALHAIYEKLERWEELEEIYHREIDLVEDTDRLIELQHGLGALYVRMGRYEEAVERFATVLENSPTHAGTVEILTRLLDQEDVPGHLKIRMSQLLIPYYKEQDDWESYARVLEVMARSVEDVDEKVRHYMDLLEVLKARDTQYALRIALELVRLRPEDEEIRGTAKSLAVIEDRLEDLISLYLEIWDRDPQLQKTLAWELARIHLDELGDTSRAEEFLAKVLEIDPLHEEAFSELEALYVTAEQWEKLKALYQQVLEGISDPEKRKELLRKLGEVCEDKLTDIEGAIAAYRELREMEPSSTVAFAALHALYELSDRWEEMVELLLDRINYVDEDEQKADILYTAAETLLGKLGRASEALATLEDLIQVDPLNEKAKEMLKALVEREETKVRAAELLTKIYELEDDFESLVAILDIRIAAAQPEEAVRLLRQKADILVRELGNPDGAFDALKEALKLAPEDEELVEALEQFAENLAKHDQLVQIYEEVVASREEGDELALSFMMRVASIYRMALDEPQKAVEWYRKVLERSEHDAELRERVVESLVELYQELQEWIDVIEMLQMKLEWVSDPDERKEIFFKIARIQEELLESPEDALQTYESALEEFVEDMELLDRLDDLYARLSKWEKLIEILERKADVVSDPEARRSLYARMALIREDSLGDIEGAVEAWTRVLDEHPDDLEALRFLTRLNERLGEWEQVLEYIDRQLMVLEDDASRVELRYRMGDILHHKLNELDRAIVEYERVLQEEPEHEDAVRALEEIMAGDDETYALQAAEILERIYLARENWEAMCTVYDLRARYAMDPEEKVSLYRKVATIYLDQLNNVDRAFDYYAKAFLEAVASPSLGEIFDEYLRLAPIVDRWRDFVDTCRKAVDDITDPELQEKVLLSIADVAQSTLGDVELAEEYYRKALENEPNNLAALDALERVYEALEKWSDLKEIYLRRAEIAYDEPDVRREKLMAAAKVARERLGEKEEAIRLYEEILEFRPDDAEVFRALEELHLDMESWDSLIALYEHRIQYVQSLAEAVEIRYSMGEIYADYLDEPERALEMFRAALGGDPTRKETIERLEKFLDDEELKYEAAEYLNPVYAANQEWEKLIKVLVIQRENTMEPEARATLTRRIASIYEEQLENLEGAFEWYGKLLVEQPDSSQVRSRLLALAEDLDKWQQLAEIFEKVLEEAMASEETITTLTETLARIYAEKLGEVDKAKEHYLQILTIHREREDLFRELEELLLSHERWEDLAELYRDAADSVYEPEKKNSYLYRLGEVLEEKLGRKEDAIDVYREILDSTPEETKAAEALERLYTALERWEDLAELYMMLVERAEHDGDRVELKLKLAQVYRKRMEDIPAALDQLEGVLAIDGTSEDAVVLLEEMLEGEEERLRIARMLEPVYAATGDMDKLLRSYEIQIEELDDDVQKIELLLKCVEIHDTSDRPAEAFEAMARAWKLDPSSRQNFDKLHDLAMRSERWEDYVRVLEEGVDEIYDVELQADVYLRMALIHEEILNDTDRAVQVLWKLLEVQEDHSKGIEILETLLEEKGRWEELVKLLEHKAGVLTEPELVAETYRKMALVQEEKLQNLEEAISAWNSVLEHIMDDTEALDRLISLYEKTEQWQEMSEVLVRRMEGEQDTDRYRELAFKAAKIFGEKLEDSFEAIRVLRALLDRVPDDLEAMEMLAGLLRKEESWDDLVQLEEKMAVLVDESRRNDLLFDMALIFRKELGDPSRSVEKLRTILEFEPSYTRAVEELHSMLDDDEAREHAAPVLEWYYSSQEDKARLVELYEKLLGFEEAPDARIDLLQKIAALQEEMGHVAEAFDAWARLLREKPDHGEAQQKLDLLAEPAGKWKELAELYAGVLDDIYDDALRKALYLKVARIYEYSLEDKDSAIEMLKAAKEALVGDMEVLRELDRLLTEAGRNEELIDVIAAEVEVEGEMSAKAELLRRMGRLRLEVFGDGQGALEAWEEAWNVMPGDTETLALMEGLMDTDDTSLLERVLDVLQPIYESVSEPDKRIALLRRRLVLVEDDMEKAQLHEQIAETAMAAGEIETALESWGEAFVLQPDSERYLSEFLKTAEGMDRMAYAMERIWKVLERSDLDADAGMRIVLQASDMALRAGMVEETERLYRKGREIDPENVELLRRMERFYRAQEKIPELMDVLEARAELEYDPAEKRVILVDLARQAEDAGDVERAISAWERVLENDDMDQEARAELMRLYEAAGKWDRLVDLLEGSISYATSEEDATALRHRRAAILEEKMGRLDDALEAWREAYDMNPSDDVAFEALLRLYEKRGEWEEIKDLYFMKVSSVEDPEEKVRLYRRMARIAVEKLKEPDEAIGYLRDAFDIDPGDDELFEDLISLLRGQEDWYELVDYYEKRANYFTSIDMKKALDLLSESARIWIERLESPDKAADIYKQILQLDPSNVSALAGLAGYYEAMENLDECRKYLDQAALLEPTGRDGAVLSYRRARVALKQGNEEDYVRLLWEAVQHDPSYLDAVDELKAHLQAKGDDQGLAKLYDRVLTVVKEPEKRFELLVGLAEIYARLGAPDAARPLVEEAKSISPDDPRIARLEGDILAAAGDVEGAEKAYMALVEQLKPQRTMRRQLAEVYAKLAQLYKEKGDTDKALQWMEEAQKSDRTNAIYAYQLGLLQFEKGDYKAAVKHFQSLLFRARGEDIGVARQDILYWLARCELGLGDLRKAKRYVADGLDMDPSHEGLNRLKEEIEGQGG